MLEVGVQSWLMLESALHANGREMREMKSSVVSCERMSRCVVLVLSHHGLAMMCSLSFSLSQSVRCQHLIAAIMKSKINPLHSKKCHMN